MHSLPTLLFIIVCTTQLLACNENEIAADEKEKESLSIPWWGSVPAIVIGDKEFYGGTCSVTQVISNDDGIKSGSIIFSVPAKLFTYCSKNEPNKNYLEYDGEYIILHVDRQTAGAGSWTGERYRSADFKSWEEYIGVTWVDSEEYEAWRRLGSTSSKADSIKKIVKK
tara:strand:- start:85464 stop:85967 length:504 start_codon:yes stop_codon:yes gene_type:complete